MKAWAFLSILCMAPAAFAAEDPRKARTFYEEGVKLYNIGEYKQAMDDFKAAYLAKSDVAFLFNIGQCHRMLGNGEQAIGAYRSYLRGKPSAQNRAEVERLIAGIEEARAKEAREKEEREKAVAAPPPAVHHTGLPFVEPTTKHAFSTYLAFENKDYVLVGVGARKVIGFTVYGMAMYVEDEPARKAFPRLAGQAGGADSRTLVKSNLVPPFIIQGEFGKHAVLWFARSVTAEQQRKSYRDALGEDVGKGARPEVLRDANQFLSLFDRDVKEGDEMVIHTGADGRVGVGMAGQAIKWGPTSLRIAHDVWDIWLGDKPISDGLKTALIERVDTLGR